MAIVKSNKIEIGRLTDTVHGILEKYTDEIADGMDAAAETAASQCLKDIRANARRSFKVRTYDKMWTKKQTRSYRGQAGYLIYCRKPGLPHLLENGHARPDGGRVNGRPHIAPAEEKAVEDFQRAVEEAINHAGG